MSNKVRLVDTETGEVIRAVTRYDETEGWVERMMDNQPPRPEHRPELLTFGMVREYRPFRVE